MRKRAFTTPKGNQKTKESSMSFAIIGELTSAAKTSAEVTKKIADSATEIKKSEVPLPKVEQPAAETEDKKVEIQKISPDDVPQRMEEICAKQENIEWPYAPDDGIKAKEAADIINSTVELRPENWGRLTIDEKRNVLQGVENRLAAATNRYACTVVFEPMRQGMNGYHNNCGKIALNIDMFKDTSPAGIRGIVTTLVHEGRHEYQAANIRCLQMGYPPIEPNIEKVQAWWINMIDLGYETGESSVFDFRQLGFKRYLAQPIEVDARAFAAEVLAKVTTI